MKHRLNLVMSEHSKNRLEKLVKLTEADTSAEVIKNALRLYEVIINRVIEGSEFLVRNKKTGETSVCVLVDNVDIDTSQIEPRGPGKETLVQPARAHSVAA